jgi:hypothetical protein
MSIGIRSERARSGFWAWGILLLIGLSGRHAAQAQLTGSAQAGESQSTTTDSNGQIESLSRGGAVGFGFGQGGLRVMGGGSPYGRLNFGRPFVPGGSGVGIYGSSFQDPLWTGLIDRGFQIMGRNSPFPGRYANGIYSHGPFHHPFYPGRYGGGGYGYGNYGYIGLGDFAYGGYGYGYGPGLYGGYVPSVYSLYGSWYPPYLPTDHVYIIEHEVVKDQPPADSSGAAKEQPRDSSPTSGADEGDYYLAPRSGETLEAALADIRHAWMNGDFARLKTRLPEKGRVRIYLKGKYKYSVDAPDFGQMTEDAMRRVDTTSFTLDHVKRLDDGRAFASGKHVYYDPEHEKHDVYVSYGLAKENGRWKITEAGSSTEPIDSHSD